MQACKAMFNYKFWEAVLHAADSMKGSKVETEYSVMEYGLELFVETSKSSGNALWVVILSNF